MSHFISLPLIFSISSYDLGFEARKTKPHSLSFFSNMNFSSRSRELIRITTELALFTCDANKIIFTLSFKENPLEETTKSYKLSSASFLNILNIYIFWILLNMYDPFYKYLFFKRRCWKNND